MSNCLVCGSEVKQFHSFGKMPIANGFLTEQQFDEEYFFELKVGFCSQCYMVQLMELVEEQKMFHENYAFFSSTSKRMQDHFKSFAESIISTRLSEDPFVVEIGSNDGIMLQNFASKNIRHLGIEPSSNVADVARKRGINSISKFFNEQLADEIVRTYGQADAFLGANVICHIPYINSVFAGVKRLLKPQGVMVFEDPYLGDIVQKASYDQIYDEHAFYFSVISLSNMLNRHDLEVIDVAPQKVHGGSMRYTISHKGALPVSEKVKAQRALELDLKLDRYDTFVNLSERIKASKEALLKLLQDLKTQGKSVAGYGATSKSTTVTNYCGITPDLVEFVSDTTPIKQGKFSPGAHIPVRPYESFVASRPDYTLLFAWNHAEEIMEKESQYRNEGGKFITYVPSVQII